MHRRLYFWNKKPGNGGEISCSLCCFCFVSYGRHMQVFYRLKEAIFWVTSRQQDGQTCGRRFRTTRELPTQSHEPISGVVLISATNSASGLNACRRNVLNQGSHCYSGMPSMSSLIAADTVSKPFAPRQKEGHS